MLEYLNTIYCLPLISTIIGMTIVYLYDKFEKKQYTSAIYIRIALLIYISSFATFYLSHNSHLFGIMSMQTGGGSSIDPQSMMPQANDLKIHLEHFKTGVPTF
jgi:hypothetical protein